MCFWCVCGGRWAPRPHTLLSWSPSVGRAWFLTQSFVTGLFRVSIFSWVSFGNLYVSRICPFFLGHLVFSVGIIPFCNLNFFLQWRPCERWWPCVFVKHRVASRALSCTWPYPVFPVVLWGGRGGDVRMEVLGLNHHSAACWCSVSLPFTSVPLRHPHTEKLRSQPTLVQYSLCQLIVCCQPHCRDELCFPGFPTDALFLSQDTVQALVILSPQRPLPSRPWLCLSPPGPSWGVLLRNLL